MGIFIVPNNRLNHCTCFGIFNFNGKAFQHVRYTFFFVVNGKICCGSACFWFEFKSIRRQPTQKRLISHVIWLKRRRKERHKTKIIERRIKKNQQQASNRFSMVSNGSIEWSANLYEYISSQHGMVTVCCCHRWRHSLSIVCKAFIPDLPVFVSFLSLGYCLPRIASNRKKTHHTHFLCGYYFVCGSSNKSDNSQIKIVLSSQFLALFADHIQSKF